MCVIYIYIIMYISVLSAGSCCLFTILDLLNLGSINHWIYQCNVFQILQSLNLESRSSHNISYFEVANPIRNPIFICWKICQPHQNDQCWISLLNYTIFNLGYMFWLVVLTILKNISQWEGLSHIIPYIMENEKCSKPPTSYSCLFH